MKVHSVNRLKTMISHPFQQIITFRNMIVWQKISLYYLTRVFIIYSLYSSLGQDTRPENWPSSSIKENQPQRDLWKKSSGPILCLAAQTSGCFSLLTATCPACSWTTPCDRNPTASLRQPLTLCARNVLSLGIRNIMNKKILLRWATYSSHGKGDSGKKFKPILRIPWFSVIFYQQLLLLNSTHMNKAWLNNKYLISYNCG